MGRLADDVIRRWIVEMPPGRWQRATAVVREFERFAQGRPLRLLDAGCGEGVLTAAMAAEHPDWQIVATDIDDNALGLARERALRVGLHNVRFIVADLSQPLPEAGFDGVAAVECLAEIADDGAAVATLVAALRPGGLIVIHVPEVSWKPALRGPRALWPGAIRFGYTASGLASLLAGAGAELISVRGTMQTPVQWAQDVRDRIVGRRRSVLAAVSPVLVLASWIEHVGLGFGTARALMAVGRRP